MNLTERLYYRDSHLKEFDARVLSISETADGRAAVVLDRTAFYPTGGGQPNDTGMLDAAQVVDCIDLEDKGVLHIIEGAAPAIGARVVGRVDWARRLDHLQQHTGQHILSQAFVKLFDAPTRAFRMLEHVSEIDLELLEPSLERIEQAVDLANEIIWQDRPLTIHQVSAEQAANMPLRKDSAREGELRIIEIEGFDMSPCGGTHAQRTGEVGVICVRSWERAKGLARIDFMAGKRVLQDYRQANRTARRVAALFSTGRDDSIELVARTLDENKNLQRRVRSLEEIEARVEAGELIDEATGEGGRAMRGEGDVTIIARAFDRRDAESLKRLALAISARSRTIALLGSRDGDNARLVFARAADAPGDMSALIREACTRLEGRGGGRADFAQGGGREIAQLDAALEAATLSLCSKAG